VTHRFLRRGNFPERYIDSVAAKNNETLDLFPDGTYVHIYRDRHDQVIHNAGTWSLNYDFGYTGLTLFGFEGSNKPDRKPIGVSTSIEKLWFPETIRIIDKEDAYI
jgi:hypothetical protein